MSISKKKSKKKEDSKKYIATAREEMRAKFGYNKLKAKHSKSQRPDMPNLKVESKYDLSNGVANGFKRRSGAEHPDAIQFPVGNGHKQGLELIYSEKYVSQMNGKKT